ncbi:MAG: ribosomal protein S18-alanine N-acetyltransferase, partial [Candidatus Helarchaeota archaeon]
ANQGDLKQLISIERESFDSPYSDHLMKYIVNSKNSINLVAENNEKIIGYIFAILKANQEGHIISIAIKPEFRKMRVGNNLVNEIIKIMKKNKAKNLVLEVRTTNQDAIKFYEKIGFKIIRVLKEYYDNKYDAFKMELIL